MNDKYWQQQTAGKPLFPDAEWSKPERRDLAGKLAIIGGNSQNFSGVAASHQTALSTGVGSVRVVLPDALKKTLPAAFTKSLDLLFAPTNPSGGFAAARERRSADGATQRRPSHRNALPSSS